MVPVGPGGRSNALGEAYCVTLAQRISTNCDLVLVVVSDAEEALEVHITAVCLAAGLL